MSEISTGSFALGILPGIPSTFESTVTVLSYLSSLGFYQAFDNIGMKF